MIRSLPVENRRAATMRALGLALLNDQLSDLDGAAWRIVLHCRGCQQRIRGHYRAAGQGWRQLAEDERRRSSAPDRT